MGEQEGGEKKKSSCSFSLEKESILKHQQLISIPQSSQNLFLPLVK